MRNRLFLMGTIILATAVACSLPGSLAGSGDSKTLETSVAATLSAVSPGQQSPTNEATVPPPEDTAEPPAVEPSEAAIQADLVVVYTHQENPWVVIDDQEPRQLSQAGDTIDVLISDDARRVVFLRQERDPESPPPVEVRAVNLDGSDEQVLLESTELDALYPLEDFAHYDLGSIDFIPGTHQLLLNTRGLFDGPGLIKNDDLLQLNADTGQLTTLLTRGQGGDFHPSPDGARLILVQPDSVGMADIDGSNLQQDILTFDPIITYSEFSYYPRPLWTADGQAAAMTIPNSDILADEPFGMIWQLPRDGSAAEQLARIDGSVYFPSESGGSVLSPGFSRAISIQGTQGNRRLTLTSIDSGSEQTYDTGAIDWRGWAPDGDHFLYSKDDPEALQLGTIGGDPTFLVNGIDLQWISDTEFLYLSGGQTNWTIRRDSIAGSSQDLADSDSRFTAFDFARP